MALAKPAGLASGRKAGYRKTIRHLDLPGHAHELTFSCAKRRPLLDSDRSRQWLLSAIDRARARHDILVLAYVIMPEHVHILIRPANGTSKVSWFLKSVKQGTSRIAKAWLMAQDLEWLRRLTVWRADGSSEFRFWTPGGGYDRNASEEKTLLEMIEYIHQNPVRRRLVEKPCDWWWSSALCFEKRTGPLRV